jgi:hypothetical protein
MPVEERPVVNGAKHNLAAALLMTGQFDRARPIVDEVVQSDRASLGENHPDYILSLAMLGGLLKESGDYAGAEPVLRDAHSKAIEVFGADDLNSLKLQTYLAADLLELDRLDEARDLVMVVASTFRALGRTTHPEMIAAVELWAQIELRDGPPGDAAALIRGSLPKLTTDDRATTLGRARFQATLARSMVSLGQPDDAAPISQESWDTLQELQVHSQGTLRNAARAMLEVAEALHRTDEVVRYRNLVDSLQPPGPGLKR